MITPYHREFLSGSLALWIGSADKNHIPDSIRCTGVLIEDDFVLRCFIAERFSDKFLSNISENKQITFVTSHPFTFTGYQYKGDVIEVIPCTPEEIEIQKNYMEVFSTGMASFGLEKQPVFDMYHSQPSLCVRLKVGNIYDQAPKQNTGGEVTL